MSYTSINEIKEEYHLESNDLGVLRDSLNQLRVKLHPDKNNGIFNHDTDKEKYHKIDDAIKYIDNLTSNSQLMVVERMTDMMKIISNAIPNSKESSLQTNLELKTNFAIDRYKSKFFIPKISLSALTGILTFLFALPNQLEDNKSIPIIINTKDSSFILLWFTFVCYTAVLWMFSYLDEEKSKRKLSSLKVESVQNEIFKRFINQLKSKTFSKDEFVQFIYDDNPPTRLKLFPIINSEVITLEIAQSISDLVLNRAEKRGLIETDSAKTLSENFLIKEIS
ncbi:hypothetical protein J2I47_17335 [Fibrella sp. HMF5335]|uniref:J domain-containing protein n=1 Tax=Fibrella rubiginis TaxID=2817060 RepID=A0A939K601_9BACT|nr:hypothetical protein [Fibrella rubiginis]MBO0938318.1 hypothetical protein [Fibrella rubiginis]